MQQAVKVELLKPTTLKNYIFMPFLDTNSYLTTKPYNFDIKCDAIRKAITNIIFLAQSLGGQNFLFTVRGFSNKR